MIFRCFSPHYEIFDSRWHHRVWSKILSHGTLLDHHLILRWWHRQAGPQNIPRQWYPCSYTAANILNLSLLRRTLHPHSNLRWNCDTHFPSNFKWVLQEAAEAEDRHCSLLNIIMIKIKRRTKSTDTEDPQYSAASQMVVWKMQPNPRPTAAQEKQPGEQSTFFSICPFWGGQVWVCFVLFSLKYFPIFHFRK